jgi:hypothetical protein
LFFSDVTASYSAILHPDQQGSDDVAQLARSEKDLIAFELATVIMAMVARAQWRFNAIRHRGA